MANDGAGTKIGNYILLAGLGAGGIVALYYVLTNFFVSPLNTYQKMAQAQLAELIKKMDGYTKTNPSGYTATQQENIDLETKILAQTTEGLANASAGIFDLGAEMVIGATLVGITVAAVKYLPKSISDYKKASAKAKVSTAQGATACLSRSFAMQLQADGFPNYAANIIASSQARFQAYDLPYMQQYVVNIEAALPVLSGIQLIVAQQMIESLNIEMTLIPTFLSLPLLPI